MHSVPGRTEQASNPSGSLTTSQRRVLYTEICSDSSVLKMFRTLATTFLLSLIALCGTFSAAVNCSHFVTPVTSRLCTSAED